MDKTDIQLPELTDLIRDHLEITAPPLKAWSAIVIKKYLIEFIFVGDMKHDRIQWKKKEDKKILEN